MDRAALLRAVAEAASATALGSDDTTEQRRLDGKRFEVRIRFGCAPTKPLDPRKSAEPKDAPFNVRFNEEKRTLRISAAPDLSLDDSTVALVAGEGVEAVEGFWMNRPWLLSDGCVASPPPPTPSTPEQPTEKLTAKKSKVDEATTEAQALPDAGRRVGLAQFFTMADSRTKRRDHRAYETTKVLDKDKQPSKQGYNLVLAGRLRQLQGDGVIACRMVGPDRPPECVASAEFDRVWIEDPTSRDVVAEWGN